MALFTRREGNLGVRRITLALSHFVFFTRRVYKAGSGYPSAFRHARGHLRVSRLVCYRLVKLLPFQNKRENYLGISFLEKLIQQTLGKTFGLSLIDSFKIVLFISSPKIFPAGLLRKSGEEFIRTLQRFNLAEILLCMWQGFEIYMNMD